MHSYYAHLPAFYQIEACCKSTVFKVPQSHYAHLVSSSHEFAQWALRYAQGQLFYLEKKDSVINGNAKERFISLIHKRPEIIEKVALKHIATLSQPAKKAIKEHIAKGKTLHHTSIRNVVKHLFSL